MLANGLININKPAEWTSQDVCAKLRRKLGTRRVGHTGTLDPMATGVLPVAFGKATRIIEYYDADIKSYRTTMQLGVTTDTLDATGTVTSERGHDGITSQDVAAELAKMQGIVTQIPPKYSALKVNGKRLYEYARAGQEVAIKPRLIHISELSDVSVDEERGVACFTVFCSKGTYIRTICDDVGRALGCGAMMTSLERLSSGCFAIADAIPLAEFLELEDKELAKRIVPMDETLQLLGRAGLRTSSEGFLNGMALSASEVTVEAEPDVPEWYGVLKESSRAADAIPFERLYRIYDSDGLFLGTAERTGEGHFKPDKVIK